MSKETGVPDRCELPKDHCLVGSKNLGVWTVLGRIGFRLRKHPTTRRWVREGPYYLTKELVVSVIIHVNI